MARAIATKRPEIVSQVITLGASSEKMAYEAAVGLFDTREYPDATMGFEATIKFNPRNLWVGVFWKTEHRLIDCDDPQCGDSTWDHACNAGGELWRHVWICLLPSLSIHISWEVRR